MLPACQGIPAPGEKPVGTLQLGKLWMVFSAPSGGAPPLAGGAALLAEFWEDAVVTGLQMASAPANPGTVAGLTCTEAKVS